MILLILVSCLKDFFKLTEISNIWNNKSLSKKKNITIENIQRTIFKTISN